MQIVKQLHNNTIQILKQHHNNTMQIVKQHLNNTLQIVKQKQLHNNTMQILKQLHNDTIQIVKQLHNNTQQIVNKHRSNILYICDRAAPQNTTYILKHCFFLWQLCCKSNKKIIVAELQQIASGNTVTADVLQHIHYQSDTDNTVVPR